MIVVVDDERTYAELFCESLSELLIDEWIIPDIDYKFSYQNRETGYIVLLDNINFALKFITDNIDQIEFIILDLIMPLPAYINKILPFEVEKPNGLEAGSYLFQALVSNNILIDKLNRIAIVTHLKDYNAEKLIINFDEKLKPPTAAFENRILQKNSVSISHDTDNILEFLREEKINNITPFNSDDEIHAFDG